MKFLMCLLLATLTVGLRPTDDRARRPGGMTNPNSSEVPDELLWARIRSASDLEQYISVFRDFYLSVLEARRAISIHRLNQAQIKSWHDVLSGLKSKRIELFGPCQSVGTDDLQTVRIFLELESDRIPGALLPYADDETVTGTLTTVIGQRAELVHAFHDVMSEVIQSDLVDCEYLSGEVSNSPRFLVQAAAQSGALSYDEAITAVIDLIKSRRTWSTYPFPVEARNCLSTIGVESFIAAFIADQLTATLFKQRMYDVDVGILSIDGIIQVIGSADAPYAFALLYACLSQEALLWATGGIKLLFSPNVSA